jgi:hypothetical protein
MEQETFWTLLRDLPHWEFELFLMVIFDVIIGALIWPRIKKSLMHHKEDDLTMASLEKRVKDLEEKTK